MAYETNPDDVFLRFEWFDSAWQWLRRQAQLRVLVVHRNGDLIGIAPMALRRARTGHPRRLGLLTVPDTQSCDLICGDADLPAVARGVAAALYLRAADWDVLSLQRLARENRAKIMLDALRGCGLGCSLMQREDNPCILLDGGWEKFYATLSRSLKKANNLATNRIGKAGVLDVQHITSSDSQARVQHAVASAIRISARSWKHVTETSLDNEGPNAFILRLTEHACREGWLSLWLLHVGANAVAAEYQVMYNGRVHALRADFDKALEAASPGTYLNRHMLERLFCSGHSRYLMGPGNNQYKRRWTTLSDPLFSIVAYSPSLRGQLSRAWIERVRPWLKRTLAKPRMRDKWAAEAK